MRHKESLLSDDYSLCLQAKIREFYGSCVSSCTKFSAKPSLRSISLYWRKSTGKKNKPFLFPIQRNEFSVRIHFDVKIIAAIRVNSLITWIVHYRIRFLFCIGEAMLDENGELANHHAIFSNDDDALIGLGACNYTLCLLFHFSISRFTLSGIGCIFVSSLIQGQISDFESFPCYLFGARGEQERQKHYCNYTLFNAKITIMKRPVEQKKDRFAYIKCSTIDVLFGYQRYHLYHYKSNVEFKLWVVLHAW